MEETSAQETELRRYFIGDMLKRSRKQLGLTQRDVAKQLGYRTAQFVSNWERGLSLPPLESLPKVVELLRIEPSILVAAIESYRKMHFELQKQKLAEILNDLNPTTRP